VFVCLKTPVIKYDFSREAAQINFPFEAVCLLNSIKSLFVTDYKKSDFDAWQFRD